MKIVANIHVPRSSTSGACRAPRICVVAPPDAIQRALHLYPPEVESDQS